MRTELGTKGANRFDIKQDSGGIMDIEFIVQYLVLCWGERLGDDLAFTDNIRLLDGLQRAGLIDDHDAQTLNEAYRTYRERNHRLSLQSSSSILEGDAFESLRLQVDRIWNRIMVPDVQKD
jgi:glutamate-ammonia-ligase adenylyltransferase